MNIKKNELRFTIYLNKADPSHLHAAKTLNSVGLRGKAQYIVNAILHYERTFKYPDAIADGVKKPEPASITQSTTNNSNQLSEPISIDNLHAITNTLNSFRRNQG